MIKTPRLVTSCHCQCQLSGVLTDHDRLEFDAITIIYTLSITISFYWEMLHDRAFLYRSPHAIDARGDEEENEQTEARRGG